MANINGNVYLKPCEGFKEELLTKSLECGTYLPRSRPNLEGGGCDVVTKRYDLYFGSCDHIGVQCYSGVFISCDHVRRSARGRPVPRNLV